MVKKWVWLNGCYFIMLCWSGQRGGLIPFVLVVDQPCGQARGFLWLRLVFALWGTAIFRAPDISLPATVLNPCESIFMGSGCVSEVLCRRLRITSYFEEKALWYCFGLSHKCHRRVDPSVWVFYATGKIGAWCSFLGLGLPGFLYCMVEDAS